MTAETKARHPGAILTPCDHGERKPPATHHIAAAILGEKCQDVMILSKTCLFPSVIWLQARVTFGMRRLKGWDLCASVNMRQWGKNYQEDLKLGTLHIFAWLILRIQKDLHTRSRVCQWGEYVYFRTSNRLLTVIVQWVCKAKRVCSGHCECSDNHTQGVVYSFRPTLSWEKIKWTWFHFGATVAK